MGPASVIPQRFHRLWFGPRPMPAAYAKYGASWVNLNPGWDFTDWRDHNLPPLRNQDVFDACGTSWQPNPGGGKASSAVAVQRADIASYELVHRYGGVYLNCDMEALRPIGPYLDGVSAFVAIEQGEFPSNAIMGAEPGHLFFDLVLDLLPKRVAEMPAAEMNVQTGPHLLREAARIYDGGDLTVFPASFAMPYLYGEMHRQGERFGPDTIAEHHWGHKVPDEELWP